MSKEHATILEIQRMSTEDGPGIRTTVFFKGCPLHCAWCHNPESISPKPQVHWIGSRCIGCLSCIEACRQGALRAGENGVEINRSLCQGCGACAQECPSTAMELMGTRWSLEDLLAEVAKDAAYFEKSGGGITVSGGEPAMQADFAAAFLAGCRERGLHTALDTCGLCAPKALDKMLPHADMVLFDLKFLDSAAHEKWTGSPNGKILENCRRIARDVLSGAGPKMMWIRTPIIPDATATEENIRAIGGFIASGLGRAVTRWDLCAFNNLCRDKYTRLGLAWRFSGHELLDKAQMELLAGVAAGSGVPPGIVCWSGSTRLEQDNKPSGQEPALTLVKGGKC